MKQLVLTHDIKVTATKTYDGNTSAAHTGGLTNLVSGDDVAFTAEFAYNSKDVKEANSIYATAWKIEGKDIANYDLNEFFAVSGSITEKAVVVSGIAANGKTYDGNTSATLDCSGAQFAGKLDADTLTVTADGVFDSRNAGDRTVNLSNIRLGGADAANYKLIAADQQQTAAAVIEKKVVTLSVAASATEVIYGESVTAALDDSILVGGDTFAGELAITGDKSTSGNWIVGEHSIERGELVINDGNNGGNYDFTFIGGTFTVIPREITVSGITAASKQYDGSTAANVNTAGAVLDNMVAGDDLAVKASGTFADASAGVRIVNLKVLLDGVDAGNYIFSGDSQTTARAVIFAPPEESRPGHMNADTFPAVTNRNQTSFTVMLENEKGNARLDSMYSMPVSVGAGAFGGMAGTAAVGFAGHPQFSGQLIALDCMDALHEAINAENLENIGDSDSGIPGWLTDEYDETPLMEFVSRTKDLYTKGSLFASEPDQELEKLLDF